MGKCLYLEGASGISGDMTVAALLDLGGSQEKLAKVLASLHIDDEFHYHVTRGESYGIAGNCFNVHCHEHDHSDHNHGHCHGNHCHEHRNLADILHIISHADMSENARSLAENIFTKVAVAEAAAHNCKVEEVHFHEVGAVDSIVDIVAAATLIDDLGVSSCIVESLAEGSGFVRCQHGELPVPVPAVLKIAEKYSIALKRTGCKGEMVTPTGIAIAAALKTSDKLPECYKIEKCGIGIGKRDFGRANILRAMLITPLECGSNDDVWVLECNIDDSSGEMLGLALEKLLANGALDAHFSPCFMKKNRPGYLLQVIARQSNIAELEYLIFENTTTIGIRRYPVQRSCMLRSNIELTLPFGKVQAKKCIWQDIVRIYPEYESVKKLAESTNLPFKKVFDTALICAENCQQ